MYCRNCGNRVESASTVCSSCGFLPLDGEKHCCVCGAPVLPRQAVCLECGSSLRHRTYPKYYASRKDKVAAALLAFFFGGLGIHKFYLGYTGAGVVMLLVSIIGGLCTWGIATVVIELIALIEGIIYLVKPDDEFEEIYVIGKRTWF